MCKIYGVKQIILSIGDMPVMSQSKRDLIDAELFEALILAGANNLGNNKKTINDLNVFPIPDGDTGENMYMTYAGGISFMKAADCTVEAKSGELARGMLLSARGNSGVILSQFFAGMADGLSGAFAVGGRELANAFEKGVKQAYSAVVTPVEGTVLTVAREAVEYILPRSEEYSDLSELFFDYTNAMKRSLERTPELLSVLAEAGVVDSGGAGLLVIFEGMLHYLQGNVSEPYENEKVSDKPTLDFSKFNENSVMTFGYCTEFLLQLQNSKVDAAAFDVGVITDYLTTIGDSLVVFKTGTVVKVHVHTMKPYKALEFCQSFGEFLTVKIENMTLQHSEVGEDFALNKKRRPKRERRSFATVAVGMGEGIVETFTELGADIVIDGGQGKNPSIEDFIVAFEDANADDVFVLPNNSNIIMAARQAADIFNDSRIHVIETKNFGEAYSILSMLDYSSGDALAICEEMTENMKNSVTGMVTCSIRSVVLDGVDVKEGDYIGFTNKTMLVSERNRVDALIKLLPKLDAASREFLIIFYGTDVSSEEKEYIRTLIGEKYSDIELYDINGGQDVYDFIVILE